MKNKLQEKLIAILLVFAMVFLTIPLAKADVIISLEENEETVNTGFAVANAGQTRGTYNISYWYSTSYRVGHWSSLPTIHYRNAGTNGNFDTSIEYAANKWSYALNVTLTTDDVLEEDDDIVPLVFFGGNSEQIVDTGYFTNDQMDDNVVGLTEYIGIEYNTDLFNKGTVTYYGDVFYKIRGYVLNQSTLTNFYNVSTHELGHALSATRTLIISSL